MTATAAETESQISVGRDHWSLWPQWPLLTAVTGADWPQWQHFLFFSWKLAILTYPVALKASPSVEFFLGQKIFQIYKSKQVSSKIKLNTNRVLFKSWALIESQRSEVVGIAWLLEEFFCSCIYTQFEDASSSGWVLAFLGYEKKGLVGSLKWKESVLISVPTADP